MYLICQPYKASICFTRPIDCLASLHFRLILLIFLTLFILSWSCVQQLFVLLCGDCGRWSFLRKFAEEVVIDVKVCLLRDTLIRSMSQGNLYFLSDFLLVVLAVVIDFCNYHF